jgi:hypothetical protein
MHTFKRYVLQNAFVDAHSDWGFNIEDLQTPEMLLQLCRECGLAGVQRKGGEVGCPSAEQWEKLINKVKTTANHDHTHHSSWSWQALFDVDPDMTTAAMMVGASYGYHVDYLEDVTGFKVLCGFEDSKEVMPGAHALWDCTLDRGDRPAPTMMHPHHFTPPAVKTRQDSRLAGEDPFNLGVNKFHDPEKQCMLAPSGEQFCAKVVCKPENVHCYCSFEGKTGEFHKVTTSDTQKIAAFMKIGPEVTLQTLRARIQAFSNNVVEDKLASLLRYQTTVIRKCEGLEPGPVSSGDDENQNKGELADRNFWAKWKANLKRMLSITGAVYGARFLVVVGCSGRCGVGIHASGAGLKSSDV